MKLNVTILATGNNTGIKIPDAVVTELGSTKKPPVKVTINGYTYRSSIASMGGVFMLPVSSEVRREAGVKGGDEVEIELLLDTEPREVELPADFADALAKDKEAAAFYNGLSYSNKRRIVTPITDAKAPETRQRRIEKTILGLREGKV